LLSALATHIVTNSEKERKRKEPKTHTSDQKPNKSQRKSLDKESLGTLRQGQ
jgi:hypothetical protein